MPQVPRWIPEPLGYRLELAFGRLHRELFQATGGRLGARLEGGDVLLLTTVGRRTGRPRTAPLTYLRQGNRLVVVASNAGLRFPPRWFLNAIAHPEVTVQVRNSRRRMLAHPATAEEREAWWPQVLERSPIQREFERRAGREIPLLVLSEPDRHTG